MKVFNYEGKELLDVRSLKSSYLVGANLSGSHLSGGRDGKNLCLILLR
jgi:hypothetical protein